jgi:hypothetical protein
MVFTRHFAHHQSVSRAHGWLTQLGFKPHQIKAHRRGTPRITLSIHPHEWAEVSLVLGAVERADAAEVPSYWAPPAPGLSACDDDEEAATPSPRRVQTAAIGWHPLD